MKLIFKNASGEEMPIFDNDYFTVTDIDGMTLADVGISSNTMADMDGDVINAQTVQPRNVTVTLRVKQTVNPEIFKRYVMQFVKPKQEGTLYMEYKERTVTLTGYIQSINMPRFSNAVAMQFNLYCSQPLWEDAQAIVAMISDVVSFHYWPIVPKEEPDIIMGEIMDTKNQTVINGGDVAIGMKMTIVALGNVSNPKIMREQSSDFFGVNVTMKELDELIISTVKGEKSVTLNGENIIDKVTKGSTWLQLEVGTNNFVIDDDYGAEFMQFSLVARERYV